MPHAWHLRPVLLQMAAKGRNSWGPRLEEDTEAERAGEDSLATGLHHSRGAPTEPGTPPASQTHQDQAGKGSKGARWAGDKVETQRRTKAGCPTSRCSTSSFVNSVASSLKGSPSWTRPGRFRAPRGHSMPKRESETSVTHNRPTVCSSPEIKRRFPPMGQKKAKAVGTSCLEARDLPGSPPAGVPSPLPLPRGILQKHPERKAWPLAILAPRRTPIQPHHHIEESPLSTQWVREDTEADPVRSGQQGAQNQGQRFWLLQSQMKTTE